MIKAHKSYGRMLTGINNNEQNPFHTATELSYERLSDLPQVMKKDMAELGLNSGFVSPALTAVVPFFPLFWLLSTKDYYFSRLSWAILNIYLWKNYAL